MGNRSLIIAVLFIVVLCIPAYGISTREVEAGIADAVENYIRDNIGEWKDADVSVTFKYAPNTFSALEEKSAPIIFKVSPIYYNYKPAGNVILPVDAYPSDGSTLRIFVRAKVEIMKNVVAAKRSIRKGEILEKGSLFMQKRDISSVRSFFTDLRELLGKEATLTMQANSVIERQMVRDKPVIARYDKVMVTVSIENLSVKAPGRAMEDGYIGRKIKVQNLITKKYFVGTVISSGEVKVEVE